MCGIAGLLALRDRAEVRPESTTRAMCDALLHRGPDAGGVWADEPTGVALGSRRLAILDPTPEGHQPMASPCGRYQIVFNGEIYNFRRLRPDLTAAGHHFREESGDTAVLVAGLTEWGLERTLARLNGMFGLAVWDRRERRLSLARDRLGQKPLYFGWARPGVLAFGSELKAFHAVPGFAPELDRRALPLLLRRAAIPAPWSVFRGVWKLPPGHLLTVSADHLAPGSDLGSATEPYWDVVEALEAGASRPFAGTADEAVAQLEELLGDAVELCLESDVPLGALLSGGIDSSLVVALMTRRSTSPVRSFSIGFSHQRYDEARHAARVAAHLGTEHTELYVTEDDALAVVPDLPEIYDEPFADSSQIPTYLVSRLAREHVTVALTGDGGDELFGGYPKYRQLATLLRLGGLPRPVRAGVETLARYLPFPAAPWWDRRFGKVGARVAGREIKEKASKLAGFLREARTPDAMTVRLLSLWNVPGTLLHAEDAAAEPLTGLTDPSRWPHLDHPIRRAMAADMLVYLPADILAKVDRASMAVSLETRVPLLDHRVVELAARLPQSLVTQKAVLRQVLHRHVPAELVERPKMGFSVPLDDWLRGRLRPWAEELLHPDRLAGEGYFAAEPVTALWRQHLAGERDQAAFLWPVLMFQAWQERWLSGAARLAPATAQTAAAGSR